MNDKENKIKINLVSRKDLDISYFAGSGKGGQAKNKIKSGVCIIHRESGSMGRASDSRSLEDNKKQAFLRMTQTGKFKIWLNKRLFEIKEQETLEERVDRELKSHNLKIEVRQNDKWVEVNENELT